jgi:hypothetical protein
LKGGRKLDGVWVGGVDVFGDGDGGCLLSEGEEPGEKRLLRLRRDARGVERHGVHAEDLGGKRLEGKILGRGHT